MDPRIVQIVQVMERRLHERLSVARLAADVSLSPARCAQLFRQETGVSPREYLHELRLERARTLLERTFLSVPEVMTRVGLRHAIRFERDIVRRFGAPPNDLRHGGQRRIAGG